jgi:mRNA interferase RelE/StbE
VAYRVELTPAAIRDLDRTPPRYAHAVLEFIYGPLAENPQRVGKPLGQDFTGLHSGRRGDYRVLYEIQDVDEKVLAHRIDHRGQVHRSR